MGLGEKRQLPYLCECGDVGCELCVPATVEEYEADSLFAPGHEPDGSVTEIDRQRRDGDGRNLRGR